MSAKFPVSRDKYYVITGQILNIEAMLRAKGGCVYDPDLISLALQDIIAGKFNNITPSTLDLLPVEDLFVDSCDGSEFIFGSSDVFEVSIDSNFKKWGIDKPSEATEKRSVSLYRLRFPAILSQMFSSLGVDLDKLCFTQHQIKLICKNLINSLNANDKSNFFLTKVGEKVAVVAVLVDDNKRLTARIYAYDNKFVWRIQKVGKIIVPAIE